MTYPGIRGATQGAHRMNKSNAGSNDPRRELAAFLRAHRERLQTPRQTGRRRTPGLRREEVAERARMSTTWYTWLEQGRQVSLSPAALARVAAALTLSPAERRYLFDLARRRDPEQHDVVAAPGSILAAVHRVDGAAYVLDRQFTAVAWNAAAARLFVGWLDARATQRNLLRFMFQSPRARALVEDWPHRAARLVAEFRAHAGAHAKDPPTAALLTELEAGSPEFRRLWRSADVADRGGGQRVFRRGAKRFVFEQLTLLPATAPGFLFVMLMNAKRRPAAAVNRQTRSRR